MLSCSPCHIFCSVVIIIHTHVILFTVLLLVNGTVLSLWLTELLWINSARYRKFCCSCPPTKKTPIFFNPSPHYSIHKIPPGPRHGWDSHWPVTTEAQGHSHASHCGLWWTICTVTVLSPGSSVSHVIVIPPMLHTHSSICHWCDIILGIDTLVKLQSLKNRYSYSTWKSLKCVHSLIRKYLNWCHSSSTLHYTVVDGMWVSLDNSACPQSMRSPCSHSVWCCHSKETVMLMSCSTFLTSEYRMMCIKYCTKFENQIRNLQNYWSTFLRRGHNPYASFWVVPPLQRWAHIRRRRRAFWTYFIKQKCWGQSGSA